MFKRFSLAPTLLRNLETLGYADPTPVQDAAIPPALAGRDLVVTAETGSGKTAAFLLPMLTRLASTGSSAEGIKGLVLCPTREIALQVREQVTLIGARTGLRSLAIYGGVGITPQLQSIQNGLDLVVATPGRLLDHLGRGSLRFSALRFLVLDEADRMLDMGFLPDLKRIMAVLPAERQTMLFSATMPRDIEELAARFLRDPLRVTVGRPATPPGAIDQRAYPVSPDRKTDLLLHLLASAEMDGMLVFVRTKHRADRVTRQLRRAGVNAACIHGDRSQAQRETALNGFRRGAVKVLVATDIAARGLDIRAVTHVVNYDLPNCPEDYVHRIGRTARAGASGNAWSLVTAEDAPALKSIEKTVASPVRRMVLEEFGQAVSGTVPPVVRQGSGDHRSNQNRRPMSTRQAGSRAG